MRDIEIIGGGLAGLSLGLGLARAGVLVSLLEAGDYPRHRVCGEFIAGLDPRTLATLGLAPLLADALRHESVAWYVAGRPIRPQRLPHPALGLSRFALDARLAEAFVAAGGRLQTGTRHADPKPTEGRVLATGRRRHRSAWIGLKLHVTGFQRSSDLEVHLGNHAYVGTSAVEDGIVNVCGLFHRGPRAKVEARAAGEASAPEPTGVTAFFAALAAAGLSGLADRLREATIDPASFCAVAGLGFDGAVPACDGIQIGDACAMIPPFTGNGMTIAFQSAATALPFLIDYAGNTRSWPDTCREINRRLRAHFRVRLSSAGAIHPFLLRPRRQRWLAALNRAHLLPFRPLYAALH